ncbi:MAG: 4-hydroxythreonine-4-phosphate dehydrogenase PdxA [Betaproteobacteria bacterium]|nr:4-hydroxythreonine-4-phosphate dehydrogenase PdxA [Betaproteobacteria bacterium]
MTTSRPAIAVTSGEPAGIGPELCAMLAVRHASEPYAARLVILGDRDVLAARAGRVGLAPRYADYDPASFAPSGGVVEVWHQPLAAPPVPGHPDPTNGASVLSMLRHACDACAQGAFAALVTAPVQKSAILDAGLPFTGHTEYFAERTGTPRVVMMLVGGAADATLRVALVTTHLPLAAVPAAITRDAVRETLAIVDADLRRRFGIAAPRIAVCGLNPHAGEGGHLGREEVDTIAPAIADARDSGIDAHGPLPADTVFVPSQARAYDAIVAMYHDQGLPVLKAASFGHGVNVTLGLPFPRTSVDHGTALDLAVDAERAKLADPGSLHAAVELAIALAQDTAR